MDQSGTMRASWLLETAQALERIFDRVDAFLKDDLLRGRRRFDLSIPRARNHFAHCATMPSENESAS
jgi:hypothetical protein